MTKTNLASGNRSLNNLNYDELVKLMDFSYNKGFEDAYDKDYLVKNMKMSKLDQLLLRISDAMKIKSAGKGRSHASAHKTGNKSIDPAPPPSNTKPMVAWYCPHLKKSFKICLLCAETLGEVGKKEL